MIESASESQLPPQGDVTRIDLVHVLARVRQRDEAAARSLVVWLYPILLPVVVGNLPQREDVEDLMQEIHLRIFGRLDQFRGEVPFEHWVRRIALNTCFDRLRRQRARPEIRWSDLSESEQSAMADSLEGESTAESAEGAADAAAVVERLLAQLSPAEAWLVRRLDLEQKTIGEVCAETGWNSGVARIRAFRARRRLRSLYLALEKEKR